MPARKKVKTTKKVKGKKGMFNPWKALLGGIIFAVISQIVHSISSQMTMSFYTDPKYFSLWSELMMPNAGSPGAEFFFASIAFALIIGVLFSVIYTVIRSSVPGKMARKGLEYGLLLFFISAVPMYFTMYLLLAVPTALLMIWAIETFIVYILGAFGIAWANK